VMLVRDGVKLIDFGIARAADQARLTRSGGSYGTQGFSAPEQQAGDEDVDAPADVYSLGALLLYAASGRTPGVVPDVEPLRAVDAGLAVIVESCLAAGPGARPTAEVVAEAARVRLPAPAPSWPSAVMSRIASRRDFAATPVGKLETVPPPDLDADTKPGTAPTSPASPRRPRGRLLLPPTVAVIALGAVAALWLVPSAPRQHGSAQISDSASATVRPVAGTTRTSSASPSPSRSASPTAKSASPTPVVPAGTDPAVPPGRSGASPAAGTAPTAASSAPAVSPTSSSISGINGGDDPTQVKGSEADTDWYGNDAACSAWLDSNGSGGLAGVLNTSLEQSCDAELYRSDGVAYTFRASWGAEKTSFIPDAGDTMWICVWNASDQADEQCSPRFRMNGDTVVEG